MSLASHLAPVVDFVLPPRCPLCGEALAAQRGLCAACWGDLVIPGAPGCALCQRPFREPMAPDAICAPCMAEAPAHDGISAATIYNPVSRRLVLAFKHGRRIALAPMLARLIAARLPVDEWSEWTLVPVPLHRWRLWRRGFNQSALLARELARLTGARLAVDALVRVKATRPLGGMGRAARARALTGAIRLHPKRGGDLSKARILLVDDVLTSGATSDACVRVLKRAGAAQVRIACFARVLDEALPHA